MIAIMQLPDRFGDIGSRRTMVSGILQRSPLRAHVAERRRYKRFPVILAAQASGHEVTTIEGLAADGALADGSLHLIQQAFRDEHGLPCGYCTPGMVLAIRQIIDDNPDPAVATGITPLADHYASGPYRAHLAEVLTRRALTTAIARAQDRVPPMCSGFLLPGRQKTGTNTPGRPARHRGPASSDAR